MTEFFKTTHGFNLNEYMKDAIRWATAHGGFPGHGWPSTPYEAHNTAYDAFYHAAFSAELVQALSAFMSVEAAKALAKVVGDDREYSPGNPLGEKNMDLWNNNLGREAYSEWKHAYDNGLTTLSLRETIYNKVINNETINNANDPNAPVWQEPPFDVTSLLPYNTAAVAAWALVAIGGLSVTAGALIGAALGLEVGLVLSKLLGLPDANPMENILTDPLVIDLNGDGLSIQSISASTVHMDLNNDGYAEKIAWVDPSDGLLAIDRNGNGTIDGFSDLFGNATTDGFVVLSSLDTNVDNKIDANDAQFSDLRIWRDLNSDGTAQATEVQSLANYGITEISLNAQLHSTTTQFVPKDYQLGASSTVVASSGLLNISSVYFGSETLLSTWIAPTGFVVSSEASDMPELKGYGVIKDLSAAMTLDADLLLQVQTLVADSSNLTARELKGEFESLLFKWAGVDTVLSDSRGSFINAQHLATLEKIYGTNYVEHNRFGSTYNNPTISFAQNLEGIYQNVVSSMMLQFYSQAAAAYSSTTGNMTDFTQNKLWPLMLAAQNTTDGFKATMDLLKSMEPSGHGDLFNYYEPIMFLLKGTLIGTFGGSIELFKAAYEEYFDLDMLVFVDAIADGDLSVTSTQNSNTLMGGAHVDAMLGAAENDILNGMTGNDVLVGGTGSDTLYGGAGNDTYIFNLGDGQDVIGEFAPDGGGWGGNDTIQFGVGITANNLVITQSNEGRDIVISLIGTTDQITIRDGVTSPDARDDMMDGARIEQIRFVDGSTLSYADILALSIIPTSGDDMIYGNELGNVLSGSAGNDILTGRYGNDTLIGGTGNDTLYGGAHDDTYIFNLGDGQDIISDSSPSWGGWGGNDKIKFGPGITASDLTVTFANEGQDIVIAINGTTDQITIHFGYINAGARDWDMNSDRIEQIIFDDNSTMSYNDLVALATASTSGDDVIYGNEFDNVLSGGAGNDILAGRYGNDTLGGGAGNDTLYGGAHDDTYIFNLGDGQDVISDGSPWWGGWGGIDTLQFGAGITAADLIFTQANNGEDIVISIAGTSDQIRLQGAVTNEGWRIEQLRFADNSVMSYAEMLVQAMAPTIGTDNIFGDESANTLSGGAGNDELHGLFGNDVLIGGTGNDTLIGGAHDDTYIFNLGDGQDVILDGVWGGWGGIDTLQFGAGIAAADLIFTQANNGEDIVISIAGTSDQIRLRGTVTNEGWRIEQLRFADNSVMSYAEMLVQAMAPTIGTDNIFGDESANTLSGGAGNDELHGLFGNDVLIGGTGNDTLIGGAHDDTYIFNLGDGQDVILDGVWGGWGGIDTLQFGAGITAADLIFTQANNGEDIVISIAGTSDQIRLQGVVTNEGWRIEQLRFADNSVMSYAEMLVQATAPTTGTDNIFGDESANTLSGGAGNDFIYGRDGDDTISGGQGGDLLYGGWGQDTFVFNTGDGADTIADFDIWADHVQLNGMASSFSEITVTDTAAGAQISYDGELVATLSNVLGVNLTQDKFIFT